MWEAVGETIKVFMEKHLIPTVLSLVLGVVALLGTPKDFYIIRRISETYYYLFICGCIFLGVECMAWVLGKLSGWCKRRGEEKQEAVCRKVNENATAGALWDYVDGLLEADRKRLYMFLENGNKPIPVPPSGLGCVRRLVDDSLHVRRRLFPDGTELFLLEEDFYALLVWLKKQYGKISRFEEKDHV